MYGLDMINTSVLGALGCDMNTFLRYFPAAETMYSLLVALAIGLILLGWVWNLFKNYGLGLGIEAEDPVRLTAKAILFIVLAYYADEIVNIALTIGGTPYAWILSSELPSLDFASFNSVLLTIIGVCANGGVALIVLILTLILAWNYIKLLFEAAERYGEAILRLLCDTQQRRTLDAILADGLHEGIPNWRVENDAIDSEGNPVLFAYTCDFPRIRRFDTALELHGMTGTLICFDYQEEALREICGQCVMLQSIDFQQFERSVLYS